MDASLPHELMSYQPSSVQYRITKHEVNDNTQTLYWCCTQPGLHPEGLDSVRLLALTQQSIYSQEV